MYSSLNVSKKSFLSVLNICPRRHKWRGMLKLPIKIIATVLDYNTCVEGSNTPSNDFNLER